MEHSVPTLDLARPWRTATLVAGTIALLELGLLVAVGVALLSRPVAERARAAARDPLAVPVRAREPKPPPKRETARPTLSRSETSVLVLNGNGRQGAAAEMAGGLRELGYVVGGVGNAPRSDFGRSVVMYRPGYRAEAGRLARDLRIRLVGPLDGLRAPELMGAHVALVIGS